MYYSLYILKKQKFKTIYEFFLCLVQKNIDIFKIPDKKAYMSKNNDKKKGLKGENSKVTNLLPFKTKSLKEKKIETHNEIWEKMDAFSKELVDAFKEKSTREALSSEECWYIFYFRVMQRMQHEMSYPSFKFYTNWTSRQLLKSHKNFMNSLDDWTSDPDEEFDLFGRRKTSKNKTLN